MQITFTSPVVGVIVVVVIAIIAFVWNAWGKKYIEALASAQANDLYARKLESLRSELNKRSFVHGVQADLEIKVYRRIRARMLKLDISTRQLGDMAPIPTGMPEPDEYKAAVSKMRDAYNAFFDAMEASKPFYPASVFAKLDAVRLTVRMEDFDRTRPKFRAPPGVPTVSLYDARAAVRSAINDAGESIRERLSQLINAPDD